jgi:inositol-phosphate transport system permease protein
LNQFLTPLLDLTKPLDLMTSAPVALIIIPNGFIGASLGMIIFTAAIRGIPEHLFHAAEVDGAGTWAKVRFITLPALRWPLSFVTIYQTLSLLVSFEYILLLTKGRS